MKRGTPDHPKTYDLAAELGIDRWGAVGILECLWHFTSHFAKRGDIGRRSNQAIARGIGWTGDADRLIEALVSTGWVDRCRCHRLRIHDWPEHCDQTLKRAVEVRSHGFIECYEDASSLLADDEQSTGQPTPLPSPEPTPDARAGAARANPLVQGRRPQLETECLRMAGELAELEDRDPVEVMAERSGYPGAQRAKVNPAAMSDDRLANTWRDLKADLDAARRKRPGPRPLQAEGAV